MGKLSEIKWKISEKNRLKKYKKAISFIKEDDSVLDLGVSPALVHTTNFFEKNFNLPNKLTCLGLTSDDYTKFKQNFPNVELVLFDGAHFPIFAKKFDFTFSNAVIEHVGPKEVQINWLKEASKITNLLFITTPNRWFPFETHTHTFFFHWLPDNIRNSIYRKIGKEAFTKNYMWLLSEKKFRKILQDAGFEIIHFYRNRILFFPLDFAVVCRSKSI